MSSRTRTNLVIDAAVLSVGNVTSAFASGSSASQTCPATGCTSSSCHATSGREGGGPPRGFGGGG